MTQVTLGRILLTVDRAGASSAALRKGTTVSKDALTMRGPVHGTKDARGDAIGSGAGAVFETYDFIGFGTAAALYFGTAFFPNSSPLAGTLLSFATLGVGFVARPLGGIIGG